MIDLSQPATPYELELPYGLKLTVRPLTTVGMATAQGAARRAVEAIERQARERTEAGLSLDGPPALADEEDVWPDLDRDGDGRVSREEFLKYAEEGFAAASEGTAGRMPTSDYEAWPSGSVTPQ